MWFLAGVVVLVLAAAFVAGSGRWGSMPEVVDDRPARLVGPGPVDAEDLREVRFSVVTRGYSMAEVDDLLARLSDQLAQAGMVRPVEQPRPGAQLLSGPDQDGDEAR